MTWRESGPSGATISADAITHPLAVQYGSQTNAQRRMLNGECKTALKPPLDGNSCLHPAADRYNLVGTQDSETALNICRRHRPQWICPRDGVRDTHAVTRCWPIRSEGSGKGSAAIAPCSDTHRNHPETWCRCGMYRENPRRCDHPRCCRSMTFGFFSLAQNQ